jgi:TonB family protein
MKCICWAVVLAGVTISAQEYTTERRPTIIAKCTARYTEEARRAKVEGSVGLTAEVHPDGLAHSIAVKRSLGSGLDETAIGALKQWRFKPGEKDGEPVTTKIAVEVNFRLNDPSKTCAAVPPEK